MVPELSTWSVMIPSPGNHLSMICPTEISEKTERETFNETKASTREEQPISCFPKAIWIWPVDDNTTAKAIKGPCIVASGQEMLSGWFPEPLPTSIHVSYQETGPISLNEDYMTSATDINDDDRKICTANLPKHVMLLDRPSADGEIIDITTTKKYVFVCLLNPTSDGNNDPVVLDCAGSARDAEEAGGTIAVAPRGKVLQPILTDPGNPKANCDDLDGVNFGDGAVVPDQLREDAGGRASERRIVKYADATLQKLYEEKLVSYDLTRYANPDLQGPTAQARILFIETSGSESEDRPKATKKSRKTSAEKGKSAIETGANKGAGTGHVAQQGRLSSPRPRWSFAMRLLASDI
ncbi:hypothetical protein VTL71DRAFT_14875 [Oculimacula yallundae]|uniref:Uncharacterized protein n=1 Tax=Oculimacula yallundae TaxID=86028 RepID=A0ABR4CF09_9HELO